MEQCTILRLMAGKDLPPEVSRTLDELFPNRQDEFYTQERDLSQSIGQRIDSLYNAMLFILEAYPIDLNYTSISKETVLKEIEAQRKACDLKKESLDELHKELERFVQVLIDNLLLFWNWSDIREVNNSDEDKAKRAIACLNEAEQFLLMSMGRPNYATCSSVDYGAEGTKYFVQYDESLPPYDDLLFQELTSLKAKGCPITPEPLRFWMKEKYHCFFKILPQDLTQEALLTHFNKLIVQCQNLEKLEGSRGLRVLQLNIEGSIEPSDWYKDLPDAFKELLKSVPSYAPGEVKTHLISLRDDFKKCSPKEYHDFFSNIEIIPEWYWVAPKTQQRFWAFVLNSTNRLEEVLSFFSSRMRWVPGAANFRRHKIWLIDSDGTISLTTADRYGSSHIASRDILHTSESVQKRHSDSNLRKVMSFAKEGQIRALETLISPIPDSISDYIPEKMWDYVQELTPDSMLDKLANQSVQQENLKLELNEKEIIKFNRPLNALRYISYTTAQDPSSIKLLAIAKEGLDKKIKELADKLGHAELIDLDSLLVMVKKHPESEKEIKSILYLKNLIQCYKNTLSSPMLTATWLDYSGRELFLSTLEDLIVLALDGYSHGTCVSGKDREGVKLLHEDTIILFEHRYQKLLEFCSVGKEEGSNFEEDRRHFVDLFVDLYWTRHQEIMAGTNAPGSSGLKHLKHYLPADIQKRIKEKYPRELKESDRLASDNEVKTISKNFEYSKPNRKLLSKLIVAQLTDDECKRLYNSLAGLLCKYEKEFERIENKIDFFNLINLKSIPKQDSKPLASLNFRLPEGIRKIYAVMETHRGCSEAYERRVRLEEMLNIVDGRPQDDRTRREPTKLVYEGVRALLSQPTKECCSLSDKVNRVEKSWLDLADRLKEKYGSQMHCIRA